jgi:long-chain acyl-CoA synthetase
MKGFWGQSDFEMALLKADGYYSEDSAVSDKRGGVTLLGRAGDTTTILGREVSLNEIEAVLRRHAGVAECAVAGLLDTTGGFEGSLHAFVAPTAKGAFLTEQDLKNYCRAFLQSYKVPARIHLRPSLPKSEDGRISIETLKSSVQVPMNSELAQAKIGSSNFLVPRS